MCSQSKVSDVHLLDFRQNGLLEVPGSVFLHERSLDTLHLDSNRISDLPRVSALLLRFAQFAYCSFFLSTVLFHFVAHEQSQFLNLDFRFSLLPVIAVVLDSLCGVFVAFSTIRFSAKTNRLIGFTHPFCSVGVAIGS